MVLFVHKKTSDTRASFSSLIEIAATFYSEAKAVDTKLPKWTKLGDYVLKQLTSILRDAGSTATAAILAEKGKLALDDDEKNIYNLIISEQR